ncbi:MAG: divalent-cation tolerance protein CutA [Vicinamibacterales bacterium]
MAELFAIVLTTLPAEADAEALARTLVTERLAACVNILPLMSSIYRWEGKVEQASERQLVIKTAGSSVDRLKARLAALHPYDVPEILVIPIADGGEAYLEWLEASVD